MARRTAVPSGNEVPSTSVADVIGMAFSPISSASSSPRLVIIDEEMEEANSIFETNAGIAGVGSTHEVNQHPKPALENAQGETSRTHHLNQQQENPAIVTAADSQNLSTIQTIQSNNVRLITTQAIYTVETYPTVLVPHVMVPMSRVRTAIISTLVSPTIFYDNVPNPTANRCEHSALMNYVVEPNQQHYGSPHICKQMCSCNSALQPSLQNNGTEQRFNGGNQPQNCDAHRSELNTMVHNSGPPNQQHYTSLAIYEKKVPHKPEIRNNISEQRYDRGAPLTGIPPQHYDPQRLVQNEMMNSSIVPNQQNYRTKAICEQMGRYNPSLPRINPEQRCDRGASSDRILPQYYDSHRFDQNEIMNTAIIPNQQHYRTKLRYGHLGSSNPTMQHNIPVQRYDGSAPSVGLPSQYYDPHYPEQNMMRNSTIVSNQQQSTSQLRYDSTGSYNPCVIQNNILDQRYEHSHPSVELLSQRYDPRHLVPCTLRNNVIGVNHGGNQPRYEQMGSYNPTLQKNISAQKHERSIPSVGVASHCYDPHYLEQNMTKNNIMPPNQQHHVSQPKYGGQPLLQSDLQEHQCDHGAPVVDHLPQHYGEAQLPLFCAPNYANQAQVPSGQEFGHATATSQPQIEKIPRNRKASGRRLQSIEVPVSSCASQSLQPSLVYPAVQNISVSQPQAPSSTGGTLPECLAEQRQYPNVPAMNMQPTQTPQQTSANTTYNPQQRHVLPKTLLQQINVAAAPMAQPMNEAAILIPQLSVAGSSMPQPAGMSILLPAATQRERIIAPTIPLAAVISANNNLGQQLNTVTSADDNRGRTATSNAASKNISRNNNSGVSKRPKVVDLVDDEEAPPIKVRKMEQLYPQGRFLERGAQQGRSQASVPSVTNATTALRCNTSIEEHNRAENGSSSNKTATKSSQQDISHVKRTNELTVETPIITLRRETRRATSQGSQETTPVYSVHLTPRRPTNRRRLLKYGRNVGFVAKPPTQSQPQDHSLGSLKGDHKLHLTATETYPLWKLKDFNYIYVGSLT